MKKAVEYIVFVYDTQHTEKGWQIKNILHTKDEAVKSAKEINAETQCSVIANCNTDELTLISRPAQTIEAT